MRLYIRVRFSAINATSRAIVGPVDIDRELGLGPEVGSASPGMALRRSQRRECYGDRIADVHGLCRFAHASLPRSYRTPSHRVGSSGVVQSTRCFLNAGMLMKSPGFISTMPSSNCNLAAPFKTMTHSC